MTTKLDLDPKVLEAATQLAKASGRSLGEVVSELARKGLGQEQPEEDAQSRVVRIEKRNGLPVFVIEPPPKPIDPAVVRRELEEDG